jgi:hypothetical protein
LQDIHLTQLRYIELRFCWRISFNSRVHSMQSMLEISGARLQNLLVYIWSEITQSRWITLQS